MSNVHKFPGTGRTDRTGDDDKANLNRERAAILRPKVETGRLLAADQRPVKEALWHVFEEAQKRGIKKRQILDEARKGHREDSTKHLSQYVINPHWEEDRKSRARPTTKAITLCNIMDAAVRLAGLDPDATLIKVFGSASLQISGQVPAAPEYEDLAKKLRDIVDVVATKQRLQDYFQKVAREGHVLAVQNDLDADDIAERVADGQPPDLEPDEIELGFEEPRWFSSLDWPITFFEATTEHHDFDHGRYLAPYPAVVLGRWSVGPRFTVKIESEARPIEGERGPFEGITSGRDWMELRLCIVPEGAEMRPRAALRIWAGASVASLRAGMPTPDDDSDEWEILQFPDVCHVGPQIKSDDPERFFLHSQQALVYPSSRSISVLVSRDPKSLPLPISKYCKVSDLLRESKYCQFLPVTGIILQDWLSHDSYFQEWEADEKATHLRVLGAALLQETNTSGFSAFKTGTIASDLDHSLLDTMAPLSLLDECAEKFVQLFEEASAVARQRREKKVARLEARLRAMRSASGDV